MTEEKKKQDQIVNNFNKNRENLVYFKKNADEVNGLETSVKRETSKILNDKK